MLDCTFSANTSL